LAKGTRHPQRITPVAAATVPASGRCTVGAGSVVVMARRSCPISKLLPNGFSSAAAERGGPGVGAAADASANLAAGLLTRLRALRDDALGSQQPTLAARSTVHAPVTSARELARCGDSTTLSR
jgi:hypothetical protein